MWSGIRTGTFSVLSAYHLAIESKVWERGSILVNPNANPVWQLIWRFQVPRAVQLFLWRACNDILPTKEKLFKRKVVIEPGCPTCGMEIKTTIHSLWWCRAAPAVWTECSGCLQKCAIESGDFLTIFEQLSNRLDREELELIAMITQNIWHRKNRVVFGGTVMSSRCLLTSVKETLKEFRKAQAPPISSNRSSPSRQTEWSKPPLSWIKLNWDAAVDQTTKMMGSSLIA
jgi:hypothetical protein